MPRAKVTTTDGEPDDLPGGERRAAGRRSSQAVLRHIIDRLPDGIVVVSADYTIRFANPAAEAMFGRPSEELIGQEFGYSLTGADAAEIEIVRAGTPLMAELRTVDAVWDDEPASLVSLRDITDRKRAEERGRQLDRERTARAEAEAANQAKSEFLAVMSHELRTPLNAVIGYAELLDLGVAGTMTPEQRTQVSRISTSGRHLLALVNELLDLAKVEAGRLHVARIPTSVAEIVESAMVLAQPQAEARGINLHAVRAIPHSAKFLGDGERAVQILTNLFSNAVKFSEAGESIRIDVEHLDRSEASRHLHGGGPWMAIRVRDTGIGIPTAQLESVFAPFVQGEGGHTRRSDGTGLGLTISRRLARLMNGDVTVQSEEDVGSTFTLWLPTPDAEGLEGRHVTDEFLAMVPPTRGIGEIGDGLIREIDAILDAFVARLRREPAMLGAATLKHTQLVDHVACMLADIASALITLDESEGTPSSLLIDSSDIQRFVADRHGSQRARLGWSQAAISRESEILREEVEASIRRCFPGPAMNLQVAEAIEVTRRYLEQSAQTTRRALDRTQREQRSAR